MVLSVSAAAESIAVNSDLENTIKLRKVHVQTKCATREKDQRLRERFRAKIPSGLTIFCRLHVAFRKKFQEHLSHMATHKRHPFVVSDSLSHNAIQSQQD